ncbi:MAG: Phosphatidate phosphatase [Noviherbaspirillum sp.]|nr:Phosphatidate phosphatase [Noviherbaspirillum sp.]
MAFLILTRAGFEDLAQRAGLSGITLYINPGVLLPEEIAGLAHARMLPAAIDPLDQQAVQEAIGYIEEREPGPVWVERGSPVAASQPAAGVLPALAPRRLRERIAEDAAALAGRALRQLKNLAFSEGPLLIIPYMGYGNAQRITLRGRVLEDEGFDTQHRDDSAWNNLAELYKRLESDQVAGARVRARFQGIEQEALTDRGGYFSFEIAPAAPLTASGRHAVELELASPVPAGAAPIRASAEVLVPPATARFGVISDIDDTILWTNVTNKLNMMLMLARSNAHTRKPFKGVSAFYRALHEGVRGGENNPLFYVSSSPWHLYPPLVEFLRVQDIPLGPLMLKELGMRKLFGPGKHHSHKLDKIESILSFYPHLQFILIGDSGEQDPEIYAEVVRRHPRAVRAIYIRNVNPDPSRIEAIDKLIEEVRTTGTQLIMVPDSEFAAAHAAGEGLIQPVGVAAVRSEKIEDDARGEAGARV